MKDPLWKKIAVPLAISLLLLLALEFATRLAMESNTVLNINLGGFVKYHPVRGTQLKANYRSGSFSINSLGILGPEMDLDTRHPDVRVLAIGDSVTFFPPERNYPIVLEENLRAQQPECNIQVVAGAVPGYCSFKALSWYRDLLWRLEPDITIVYLGWNDVAQYHPFGWRHRKEILGYSERTLLGRAMEHIYAFRMPYYLLGRLERMRPVDRSPLTESESSILDEFWPAHYYDNLYALVRESQENKSSVFLLSLTGLVSTDPTDEEARLVFFPRGMKRKLAIYAGVVERYREAMKRVARDTGTEIIDLDQEIRASGQRGIFTDSMHINDMGVAVFGDFITGRIKTEVAGTCARIGGGRAEAAGVAEDRGPSP